MITLTPADEAELDRWWAQQPRRPRLKLLPSIPFGAPTCSITCRVCGARDTIAVDWPGRICRSCRADLPATRGYVLNKQAETATQQEAEHQRWTEYRNDLDDQTRARWNALDAARDVALSRLRRAETGRYHADDDPRPFIERGRAEWDAVATKIARTRATVPALAAVLEAEERHIERMNKLTEEAQRWQIALQEIEIALEELPL